MSKNWLWWGIGSVTLLAGGTLAFFYFRNKKAGKSAPEAIKETVNTVIGKPEGQSPFTNKADGDAFRLWVNQKYPDWAKTNELDPSGSFTNSYILKAWNKFGEEYTKSKSSSSSSSAGADQNPWPKILAQMTASGTWGTASNGLSNSRIDVNAADKLRFGIDVNGFFDVYANFTPDGGFWLEKMNGVKHPGSWSFKDGMFTLSMADQSFSASDSDVADMVKQVMKMKFPDEMKYYSATGNENNPQANMQRFLSNRGKKYLEYQDELM